MIKTIIACDGCGKELTPKNGITVQGNIYVASTSETVGGLIGNNITDGEVKESSYCVKCFWKAMTFEFREETREFLNIASKKTMKGRNKNGR